MILSSLNNVSEKALLDWSLKKNVLNLKCNFLWFFFKLITILASTKQKQNTGPQWDVSFSSQTNFSWSLLLLPLCWNTDLTKV